MSCRRSILSENEVYAFWSTLIPYSYEPDELFVIADAALAAAAAAAAKRNLRRAMNFDDN
jgi:hypothetical protein